MKSNTVKSGQRKAPGKSQTQLPRTGFGEAAWQWLFGRG